MADIVILATNADLPTTVLKVNELIAKVNAHETELEEIYANQDEPSKHEDETPPALPTTPAGYFTVTIASTARDFKFNVPQFYYNRVKQVSTDVLAVLLGSSSTAKTAATAMILDLVAKGSYKKIDGTKSGILTERTHV